MNNLVSGAIRKIFRFRGAGKNVGRDDFGDIDEDVFAISWKCKNVGDVY